MVYLDDFHFKDTFFNTMESALIMSALKIKRVIKYLIAYYLYARSIETKKKI